MKPVILQLLSVFLLTTVFVSSRGNGTDANCKLSCLPKLNECGIQIIEKKTPVVKEEQTNAEYPFALAPGSYMFRY